MREIGKWRAMGDFRIELTGGEVGRRGGKLYMYLSNAKIESSIENEAEIVELLWDEVEKILRFKVGDEGIGIFYDGGIIIVGEEGVERVAE